MGCFQWAVRTTTEVENQMVSVERVIQYSQLPMEPSLTTLPPHSPPPPNWPTEGEIVANNLTLKYLEEGPTVIKGISFKIHSCDKIGIVGRTGSGKTSLVIYPCHIWRSACVTR
jgi:ATP-binding cassette subfamily C (CFTR/MRP) protein 4